MSGRNIFKSIVDRFAKGDSGATAVEFALIGPVFFALLFAILETSLIFFAQQALQTATTQASRLVLTGQAQSANLTAAQFKSAVCTAATSLFNCANLYVNMQTFSSFSNVTMMNPVSTGTFSSSGMSYTPGNPGDVVVVQVFYLWPVWPGPLGFNMSNSSGNTRVLVGTAAFRNEP
jgi:Flp pilus assembly protein TadG